MSVLKKLNKVSPSPTAEGRDVKMKAGKVTSIMHSGAPETATTP